MPGSSTSMARSTPEPSSSMSSYGSSYRASPYLLTPTSYPGNGLPMESTRRAHVTAHYSTAPPRHHSGGSFGRGACMVPAAHCTTRRNHQLLQVVGDRGYHLPGRFAERCQLSNHPHGMECLEASECRPLRRSNSIPYPPHGDHSARGCVLGQGRRKRTRSNFACNLNFHLEAEQPLFLLTCSLGAAS